MDPHIYYAGSGSCFLSIVNVYNFQKALSYKQQVYDFIEFYAGRANVTNVLTAVGLRTLKLDILYFQKETGNNYYDILTDAGMAQKPQ